jgi:hypothetical protein
MALGLLGVRACLGRLTLIAAASRGALKVSSVEFLDHLDAGAAVPRASISRKQCAISWGGSEFEFRPRREARPASVARATEPGDEAAPYGLLPVLSHRARRLRSPFRVW